MFFFGLPRIEGLSALWELTDECIRAFEGAKRVESPEEVSDLAVLVSHLFLGPPFWRRSAEGEAERTVAQRIRAAGAGQERRVAAAKKLAEKGGGAARSAARELQELAVRTLRPLTERDVVRWGEGPEDSGPVRSRQDASVFLFIAEVILHPDDPLKRAFSLVFRPYRSRSPARGILMLERHLRKTLEPLAATEAYAHVCERLQIALSREQFLEELLNQGLLAVRCPGQPGEPCLVYPPLLEPWEIAQYILKNSRKPLTPGELQDQAQELLHQRHLLMRVRGSSLTSSTSRSGTQLRKTLVQEGDQHFLLLDRDRLGLPQHLAEIVPQEAWPGIQDACANAVRSKGETKLNAHELLARLGPEHGRWLHYSPHLLGAVLRMDGAQRFKPTERPLEYNVELRDADFARADSRLHSDEVLGRLGSELREAVDELTPRYARLVQVLDQLRHVMVVEGGFLALVDADGIRRLAERSRFDLEQGFANLDALSHALHSAQNPAALPYHAKPAWGGRQPPRAFPASHRPTDMAPPLPLPARVDSEFVPRISTPEPADPPPPPNPYREGTRYHDVYEHLVKSPASAPELLEAFGASAEPDVRRSTYAVRVVTSPRKDRNRSDPRGSASAHGHLYYAVEDKDGRFHLHERIPPLPRRNRRTPPR